jgi:hypothetical protein
LKYQEEIEQIDFEAIKQDIISEFQQKSRVSFGGGSKESRGEKGEH